MTTTIHMASAAETTTAQPLSARDDMSQQQNVALKVSDRTTFHYF